MKERLINLAAGISMLLCLGTGVLSVRSNFVGDHFVWAKDPLFCGGVSATGVFYLELAQAAPMSFPLSFGHSRVLPGCGWENFCDDLHPTLGVFNVESNADRLEFGYVRGQYDFTGNGLQPRSPVLGVHAPIWFVSVAFGVPPLILLLKHHRRERRTLHGWCSTCGYDLRASVRRCPECGTSALTYLS